MDISQKILSNITVFNKYAKFLPDKQKRENWDEICTRNAQMHVRKYPQLEKEINDLYDRFVRTKKVVPSMRSMQFGGRPIELTNNRLFNCAYVAVDNPATFWESTFLLLGGSGVGYSVQTHHVEQLPLVQGPKKSRRYLVGDSVEGWADAVRQLVRAYFEGRAEPEFDFRDIRPKGARLITSGGKAPGPDPLRICLDHLRSVLNQAIGRNLTTLECHDMMCHIADAVLSGGIRRAALISLFSIDDYDMLGCKSGAWWELNPQRGRANNSVVLKRNDVTKEQFDNIWQRVKNSGSGEPGFFWTNDLDIGTNPCCFIGNTPVSTSEGIMTIESIVTKVSAGNSILVETYNEISNSTEFKPVIAGQLTKKDANVITLEIEKDTGVIAKITCTPEHLFLTKNRGWVRAIDLSSDDDIVEQNCNR